MSEDTTELAMKAYRLGLSFPDLFKGDGAEKKRKMREHIEAAKELGIIVAPDAFNAVLGKTK